MASSISSSVKISDNIFWEVKDNYLYATTYAVQEDEDSKVTAALGKVLDSMHVRYQEKDDREEIQINLSTEKLGDDFFAKFPKAMTSLAEKRIVKVLSNRGKGEGFQEQKTNNLAVKSLQATLRIDFLYHLVNMTFDEQKNKGIINYLTCYYKNFDIEFNAKHGFGASLTDEEEYLWVRTSFCHLQHADKEVTKLNISVLAKQYLATIKQ